MRSPLASLIVLGATVFASSAEAHPHVLVTVTSEIVYAAGKIAAVKQSWVYDPAYSALVRRNLDTNGDGQYSDQEFGALAKTQMDAFGEFGFFTTLTANGSKAEFAPARDYWIDQRGGGALVLTFTLPLKVATTVDKGLALDIYDPQFYALFSMAKDEAVRLTGAPEGCAATATGPEPIDMTQPRSWSTLLYAAVDGSAEAGRQFMNRSTVTCR